MFGVNQEKLYVLEINQQAWVIQPAKIGQIVWFSRDLIKKKLVFPKYPKIGGCQPTIPAFNDATNKVELHHPKNKISTDINQ